MAGLTSYGVAALPYLALVPWRPYPLSFAVKLLPLMWLAWSGRSRKMPWLWWAGLLLSAVGDVLLDLDRSGLLVAGICFFSLAYVFYGIEFSRHARVSRRSLLRAIAIVGYIALFAGYLLPQVGELRVAVLVYSLVLAQLGALGSLGLPTWPGWVGVCSLLFSDTLIGLDEFVPGVEISRYWIIASYYFGQWGVAAALSRR